jgi:RNA polymerase sigma factor (TIGR02999 family)
MARRAKTELRRSSYGLEGSTSPAMIGGVLEVTQLLSAVDRGEAQAADQLLPLVYDELRKLAAHKLSLLPPGQTLQATALVHEAWLKLIGGEKDQWQNRRHFFAAAAEAMRHILIDRARRRQRVRHGANAERIDLDQIEIPVPTKDEVLLQLSDALDELQTISPERAEIVKLRFFAGFSEAEIAALFTLSERSVQRHWSYAKAWLFDRIEAMKTHRAVADLGGERRKNR